MSQHLPDNSQARKELPITSGVLDYFPNAIAEVARVSKFGNDKHNPGEPLHWSRDKSNDHADCVARHLLDRGGVDENGVRHSAQAAWRMLALLEEELIADGAEPGRGTSNGSEPGRATSNGSEPGEVVEVIEHAGRKYRKLGRPPEVGEFYMSGGELCTRTGRSDPAYVGMEAVEEVSQ